MIIVTETDDRFYLKESTLPGAGLGCFARVPIARHDFLEILGVKVEYGSLTDRCTHYADRYKFAAEPASTYLKYAVVPLGLGGMVNQANTPEQQNVAITHLPADRACRNPNADQVVYLAIRDIAADEELLGNYGKKIKQLSMNVEGFDMDAWQQFLQYDLYQLGMLR